MSTLKALASARATPSFAQIGRLLQAPPSSSFAELARLLQAPSRDPMQFYLGTHMPSWLADPRFARVPLFVSRRTLAQRKRLPRAVGRWALDSGGFTELQMYGRWTLTARQYAAEVRRFRDEVGGMDWAAPQDWMCEPIVIAGGRSPSGVVFAGTHLSVEEHQRRTVRNFVELRSLAPDLPIIPVLQGRGLAEYWRCEDLYRRAGVDLRKEPRVGVGTVCRRQDEPIGCLIMHSLASGGLKLHGFGFKTGGLQACQEDMASADSLAWSLRARRAPPLPGHDQPGPGRKGHINCANCAEYALLWRARLLKIIGQRPHGPRRVASWDRAATGTAASSREVTALVGAA